VEIFMPDGSPEGLRLVSKHNWTGIALVCSRSEFSKLKARQEPRNAGVYFLLGPTTEGELPKIYIGEGDPAISRLESHVVNKDFWTSIILLTSKTGDLNKAHVQHLEASLIHLAKQVKRCSLENGNTPEHPSLSEAEKARIDAFFDEILFILPLLGCTAFQSPSAYATSAATRFYVKGKDVEASGYDDPKGFTILKNSQTVKKPAPSCHRYVVELREELLRQGVLLEKTGCLQFTQDYLFSSSSTASDVVLGRSSSGPQTWRDKNGRTLKEVQLKIPVRSGRVA
jgi:hypothetical protein